MNIELFIIVLITIVCIICGFLQVEDIIEVNTLIKIVVLTMIAGLIIGIILIIKHAYKKHKNEFDSKSKESYKQKAIKFANTVDKKNCKAYVDINGTTYKFNNKTKELVIVSKNGTIITYYKVNKGFEITVKEGVKQWIK